MQLRERRRDSWARFETRNHSLVFGEVRGGVMTETEMIGNQDQLSDEDFRIEVINRLKEIRALLESILRCSYGLEKE